MAAPPARYSGVAMALHWLMALLAIAALAAGHGAAGTAGFRLHMAAGAAAFAVTLAALVWRRVRPPPPLPAWMTLWERRAAALVHLALWLLLLALPLSGWAMAGAGTPARTAHALCAGALAGLLAVHLAAIVKHRWFDRADMLARILPGR